MYLIQTLSTLFQKERDPVYAKKQSAYLKDQFLFFGISKPKRAALQKEVFAPLKFKEEELQKIARDLWKSPEREFKYAAIDLLIKHKKHLTDSSLSLLETMIRTHSWWDTVDLIGSHLVGSIVFRFPKLRDNMDKWISDPHLWIKRSALLCQLKWKKDTDEKRLAEYCEALIYEKDFFLRKGIGWVLREYSKTNPDFVLKFIKSHPELSPLSIREASKYLSLQNR